MRLIARLPSGEIGRIVGYAPGPNGRPLAVVVVGDHLRDVPVADVRLVRANYAPAQSADANLEFDA